MVILHFRERPPFQREIGAHKKFGGSIKETVSLAKHVDSPTSVRTALVPTHFLTAGPKNSTHDLQLYSLTDSPICFNEVEKSLINYPSQDVASELVNGLKYDFPLQYSGTHLPFMAKSSRTVFQRPNLVRQKIDKELSMGRIAGPFINPPFPTFRISPIGLVQKKDGDFRMIHNLSHPMHNSVNDFIDSEFCSVRYANIDDAVKLVKRIG